MVIWNRAFVVVHAAIPELSIRGHNGQNSTETGCRGFLVLESLCRGFSALESECHGLIVSVSGCPSVLAP